MQIPVILLTGFLGAGKTTLINWILKHHSDRQLSVLLNEFGDISLESRFLTDGGLEVAEIANGCMCCAARDDIPLAIRYILEHAPATRCILIEASGLSDPEPIHAALSAGFQSTEIDADLSQLVRLDTTVCVIDAQNFLTTRQTYGIVNSQLGDAEFVVLNKTSLAGPEVTQQVRQVISSMVPQARIFEFDEHFPGDLLFEPTLQQPPAATQSEAELQSSSTPSTSPKPKPSSQLGHSSHDHDHHSHDHQHQAVSEFWYRSSLVFSQQEVTYFLRSLPQGVFRVKGLIQVQSESGETYPLLVSSVAGRVEWRQPETAQGDLGDTADADPKTGILFLGLEFNQAEIKAGLERCQAAAPQS